MSFRAEVMGKLEIEGSAAAAAVLALINSQSLYPTSNEPARTTASEALRLWRTRLRNTKFTQKNIQGLPQLVERLEAITPNKKVDYFGFSGENSSVTLLFETTSGAFIGSAVVETEPALRQVA